MNQSNLVDLTKISRITTETAEKIQNLLGLESPELPLGLVDAANEILIEEGIAPIRVAWPPISNSDSAPLANCEVLSHIAKGPPSLVTRKNGQSVLPLVGRLCATFPNCRIVVTVLNERQAIELVNFLRSNGHESWYLDKEYPCSDDQERPDHRIKVVTYKGLHLSSLDLHWADIVIVTDAARFVSLDTFGFLHQELFDHGIGTHFKSDVRLVGIVEDDAQPKDMGAISQIFGLRNYLLGPKGEAFLAPRVTWVTRAKQDRSLFTSGLTHDSTNLEKMRTLVWANQARNQSIIRIARRLLHEARTYPYILERYGNSICNPVAIVTENLLHRRVLVAMQEAHKVRVPVMAFEDIAQRGDLPSFLLRADAGTGLLPLRPQRNGVWVVDVADQTSKYLSRRVRLRQKAYLRHWHVGEQPFVSKLTSFLKPKHA